MQNTFVVIGKAEVLEKPPSVGPSQGNEKEKKSNEQEKKQFKECGKCGHNLNVNSTRDVYKRQNQKKKNEELFPTR